MSREAPVPLLEPAPREGEIGPSGNWTLATQMMVIGIVILALIWMIYLAWEVSQRFQFCEQECVAFLGSRAGVLFGILLLFFLIMGWWLAFSVLGIIVAIIFFFLFLYLQVTAPPPPTPEINHCQTDSEPGISLVTP